MTQSYAAQTFTGIDAAKWARIQAKVKESLNIDMSNNVGAGSHDGVTISWVYSSETQTLITDLVNRSFLDPSEQTIDAKLAAWINAA